MLVVVSKGDSPLPVQALRMHRCGTDGGRLSCMSWKVVKYQKVSQDLGYLQFEMQVNILLIWV